VGRLSSEKTLGFVAAAVALSCCIAAFHGQLSPDYGSGFFSTNGAAYCGRIVTNLLDYPAEVTHLGAPLFVLEGPDRAEPLVLHYTNHPPAYYGLLAMLAAPFDGSPLALKGIAVFFHVATALGLASIFLPLRPYAALASGVLAATLPAASHYGFMCSAFGPSTLLTVLALWALTRKSDDRIARWTLRCTLVFAGMLDWNSILLIPCVVLAALGLRRPRVAAEAALLGLMGMVLMALHVRWILGSWSAIEVELTRLSSGALVASTTSTSGWWEGMWSQWESLFGAPALVLALIQLCVGREMPHALRWLALLPGLLLIALFSTHAVQHEYWSQALLPAVALLAGGLLGEGLASRFRWLRYAALSLLVILAAQGLMRASQCLARDLHPDGTREFARALDAATQPGDVVLFVEQHREGLCAHTTKQILTGFDSMEKVLLAASSTGELVPRLGNARLVLVRPRDWPDSKFTLDLERLAPSTSFGPVAIHDLTPRR
jgi:hypothetical protein